VPSRFCMGRRGSTLPKSDFPYVLEMTRGLNSLGLESCVHWASLKLMIGEALIGSGFGLLQPQFRTPPQNFTTVLLRTKNVARSRWIRYQEYERRAFKLCCGWAIMEWGRSKRIEWGLLRQLSLMSPHPESVPINMLVKVEGTPM